MASKRGNLPWLEGLLCEELAHRKGLPPRKQIIPYDEYKSPAYSSEYKAKKRESVLRAFESVLSSLVQEMSAQEGWTEALGAALEAAVEREKEGFKACLDEDPK